MFHFSIFEKSAQMNFQNILLNETLLQASGVTVSDVCKTTYEEIKKDKKHRYVVFYIKDEKQIDVEYIGMYDLNYYGLIIISPGT